LRIWGEVGRGKAVNFRGEVVGRSSSTLQKGNEEEEAKRRVKSETVPRF